VVQVEPLTSVGELSSVRNVNISQDTACPEDFIRPEHGEYCYYFSNGYDRPLTWLEAAERCRTMVRGGTLVRPFDEMTDAFIINELKAIANKDGHAVRYWMDLNRMSHTACVDWSSAPWLYSDGSPAPSYKNFWPDQPDHSDCEHCGDYWPRGDDLPSTQWHWNDEACGTQWRYICQVAAQY